MTDLLADVVKKSGKPFDPLYLQNMDAADDADAGDAGGDSGHAEQIARQIMRGKQ
jgi:hypothetical protein